MGLSIKQKPHKMNTITWGEMPESVRAAVVLIEISSQQS
jgi:hypothetical protein